MNIQLKPTGNVRVRKIRAGKVPVLILTPPRKHVRCYVEKLRRHSPPRKKWPVLLFLCE